MYSCFDDDWFVLPAGVELANKLAELEEVRMFTDPP